MQGAALVGVFLRVAPFVAKRGLPHRRADGRGERPAHQAVGKRGGAVVDANLELIRAAYQELIDVTAPLRAAAPAAAAGAPRRHARNGTRMTRPWTSRLTVTRSTSSMTPDPIVIDESAIAR